MSAMKKTFRTYFFVLLFLCGGIFAVAKDCIIIAARALVAPNGRVDTVLFCPQDGQLVEDILIGLIRSSKKITGALFRLSEKNIIDELLAAHKRGIPIQIVFDSGALSAGSASLSSLAQAGVSLFLFDSKKEAPKINRYETLMHHKFLVFQGTLGGRNIVAFGSMNVTQSGLGKNSENFAFRDEPTIVKKFIDEADRLKEHSNKFVFSKMMDEQESYLEFDNSFL